MYIEKLNLKKTSEDSENYKKELTKLKNNHQNLIKINKSLINKNKKLKRIIKRKDDEIDFLKNELSNEIGNINNEINNIDEHYVWKKIMNKIDFDEYNIIYNSDLFNKEWYVKKYFKTTSDIDPIYHYLTEGVYKGYNPNPYFNTKYYLEVNVDVRAANINPLVHYIKYGIKENRKISKFDE